MSAGILLVIMVLLALGYLAVRAGTKKTQQLRDSGIYPLPGQETETDINRLLQLGLG